LREADECKDTGQHERGAHVPQEDRGHYALSRSSLCVVPPRQGRSKRPRVVPTRREEGLAAVAHEDDTRDVILFVVLAAWIVMSLVVGLAVVALCRAGHAEEDRWAVMDPAPTRRRPSRPPRTSS